MRQNNNLKTIHISISQNMVPAFFWFLEKGVKKEIKKSKSQNGIITIKFFNLVLKELGPAFLKSGMLVSKKELSDFFSSQPENFLKACESVKINGKVETIEAFKQIDTSDDSDLLLLYVMS